MEALKKMRNRLLFLVFSTVIIGALAALGAYAYQHYYYSVKAEASQPFTAIRLTRYFGQDGVRQARAETSLFATRSDGSTLEHRLTNSDGTSGLRIIYDPSKGTRISVDPFTESKTTYNGVQIGSYSHLVHTGLAVGPPEQFLGYEVVKIVQSLPENGPPQGRHTLWVAPALNYYALRAIAEKLNPDGSVQATTTEDTVSVLTGEPDANSFQIPISYTERSPSEVYLERERRSGKPCPTCGDSLQKLDHSYYQRRKPL